MASKSLIEWTDATWNPIRRKVNGKFAGHFCVKVSEGCTNCYAERMQPRFGHPIRYAAQEQKNVDIYLDEKELLAPLRWKKPRMIFVGSMTDIFGDWVSDEWLDKLYAVMALCPQHTFQVLTKRSERMREYTKQLNDCWYDNEDDFHDRFNRGMLWNEVSINALDDMAWPLPNVWHGVSVEDQPTADLRIPDLLGTPSTIRFISAEPLLAGVDLNNISVPDAKGQYQLDALEYIDPEIAKGEGWNPNRIDWVIAGGESGPKARPSHPDWFRAFRDQCAAANVPFFFKQWGEWVTYIDRDVDDPDWQQNYTESKTFRHLNLAGGCGFHGERVHHMQRIGKKAAGNLLDGVKHEALPEVSDV